MKEIGITGGIGAGKSTVSRIFKTLRVPVYDADKRAREITDTDKAVRDSVVEILGAKSYDEQGLNRKYVAYKVFQDGELLAQLNQIIHPAVAVDYRKWVSLQASNYILREAALIFETGSDASLDAVILVTAPRDLRIDRVLHRDSQRDRQQIEDIMSNQLSEEEKTKKANYIIFNDGIQMVIPQVLTLHEKFRTS